MTDTPNPPKGFIPHEGGECPVPKGAIVDISTRGGEIFFARPAEGFNWNHARYNAALEIIGYKLHTPPIDWQARTEKAEADLASARQDIPYMLDQITAKDAEIAALKNGVLELAHKRMMDPYPAEIAKMALNEFFDTVPDCWPGDYKKIKQMNWFKPRFENAVVYAIIEARS